MKPAKPKKPTTESALLAAILASPDDELPRLVYADWCDENDQPERAEFIRTQIEMAKMMPDKDTAPEDRDHPRYRPLERRANELWNAHSEEWFPWIDACANEVSTHRGFPYHISTSAAKFVAHSSKLFASAGTINDVILSEIEGQAAALADCPALAQIERLSFFETPFVSEHAQDFFRSPHLHRLKCFDIGFSESQCGTDGAVALAGCESLVSLEDLNLSEQGIGDEGALAVLNQPRFRTLTALVLDENGLTDAITENMNDVSHFVAMRLMKLRWNGLTATGISRVCRTESLAGLEELDLTGNPLTFMAADQLTTATFAGRLRKLGLYGCQLGGRGTADLFASRSFPRLEELSVSRNTLVPGSVRVLGEHDGFRALRDLSVSDCRVTAAVAGEFAKLTTLPNLRRLLIGRQPLGPNGLRALLAGPLVQSLETLDLEKAELGDAGAEVIAAAELPNLKSLYLSDNGITDAGARVLVEAKSLANLSYLSLKSTALTDAGKAMVNERFPRSWV